MGKPFDKTFLVFLIIALVAGAACYHLKGAEVTLDAVRNALGLALFVAPQLLAGLMIGGLIQAIGMQDKIRRFFGGSTGWRGLVLGSVAGALTPSGPFASFPLVIALWKAGADLGAVVAYITGWALIGVHRLIVWEIPLMGAEFSLVRLLISLPMPVLAGYLARVIARNTSLNPGPPGEDGPEGARA
ncbi:permease [Pseudoruegeria sp. HB172150]|uniref:permease n=1 Tax=Pseudoruegeria sp. HB172150 TaxID=2721164 RepID=UPI001555E051|nr:permease [Pseudoruegeria sp. HB172150]